MSWKLLTILLFGSIAVLIGVLTSDLFSVVLSPKKPIEKIELKWTAETPATTRSTRNMLPTQIFDIKSEAGSEDWRFSSMESQTTSRGEVDEKVTIRNHRSLHQEHDDDSSMSLWLPKNPLTTIGGSATGVDNEYIASFLFRTSAGSSGSGGVGLFLTFNSADGSIIENKWTELLQTDGSWKKYEATFKVPASTFSILLRVVQKDMRGTSWFSMPQMDMLAFPDQDSNRDSLKSGELPSDKSTKTYWNWEDFSLDAQGMPPGFIANSGNGGACGIETEGSRIQGNFALVLEGPGEASWELPIVDCSRWGEYSFEFYARASDRSAAPVVTLIKTDFYGKTTQVVQAEPRSIPDRVGEWLKYSCTFETGFLDAFTRISITRAESVGRLAITGAECRLIKATPLTEYKVAQTTEKQWQAEWISPASINGVPTKEIPSQQYYFYRKAFNLTQEPARVILQAAGDDKVEIFVNGEAIGRTKAYNDSLCTDITEFVKVGSNVIGAKVFNASGFCAVVVECTVLEASGQVQTILTDPSWKSSLQEDDRWLDDRFDDTEWEVCVAMGKPPVAPWGEVKFVDTTRVIPSMVVTDIAAPASVVAGNALNISIAAERLGEPLTYITSSLVSGETEFMRQTVVVPQNGGTVDLTFQIPEYFLPGQYKLSVTPEQGFAQLANGLEWPAIQIQRRPDKVDFPAVAVKRELGSLIATVNGKPVSLAQYWMMPGLNEFGAKEFGNAGFRVFRLDTGIGWKGEGKFDYTQIDRDIVKTLMSADDSMIVVEFTLDTTLHNEWWADKYPEELCSDAEGNTLLPYYHASKKRNPSWQSTKYRADFGDALRRFIRHLRQAPYADRIIMLSPCSGVTYEWYQWGSQSHVCVDYSRPARVAFQDFMRSLCKDDAARLRSRWNDESVTFENLEIPSPAERTAEAKSFFRTPQQEQRLIDYHLFHDYHTGFDALEYFSRIIKEESQWKLLVGTYNSYNYLAFGFSAHNNSQLNMRRLARSRYIDALYAPADGYHTERSPGGTGGFMTAPSSCNLWNKLLFQEADNRTFWDFQKLRNGINLSEDINIFRRELCLNIAFDCEVEYLDFNRGYQSGDPRLTAELGKLKRVRDISRQIPRKAVRQVAVFADDAALPLVPYPKGDDSIVHIESGFIRPRKFDFLRSGVKCDYFVLSDLENQDFSTDYKVYFFLNTWRITDAQRKLIDSKLKRSGNVLVFFYGAGYFIEHDQAPSVANIESLTGISLREEPGEIAFLSNPVGVHALASSIAKEAGVNRKMAPHFVIADSAAVPLRSYKEDENKISMAVKKVEDWTSIYSALPGFGPDFIRACARMANCHIYNEGNDALYITGNFVGMHTRTAGKKVIQLPHETGVYEIFSGQMISRKTDRIEWEAKEKTTYLFFLGESQDAERLFKNAKFE